MANSNNASSTNDGGAEAAAAAAAAAASTIMNSLSCLSLDQPILSLTSFGSNIGTIEEEGSTIGGAASADEIEIAQQLSLPLPITESEGGASTAHEEEGNAEPAVSEPAVEAIMLDANQSLAEQQSPGSQVTVDSITGGDMASVMLSPSSIDTLPIIPLGEISQQSSSMAPFGESADNDCDSRDSPDLVMYPCSPGEQSKSSSVGTGPSSPPTMDDGAAIASNESSSRADNNLGGLAINSSSSSLLDAFLGNAALAKAAASEDCDDGESMMVSDAGESMCASTAPVINLTVSRAESNEERDDGKLVTLSILAKASMEERQQQQQQQQQAVDLSFGTTAATLGAGTDEIAARESGSFYTAKESGSVSKSMSRSVSKSESNDELKLKTTISSGSDSPLQKFEASADSKKMSASNRLLGRISPIKVPDSPVGAGEQQQQQYQRPRSDSTSSSNSSKQRRSVSPKKNKSPLPISPSSAYSTGSGYDKKRLSERLRQRLAKRNQMHASSPVKRRADEESNNNEEQNFPTPVRSPPSVPSSPGAAPSPLSSAVRERSKDRSQWETRLQAASREKRRSKSRAASETGRADNSATGILSKHSRSSNEGSPVADGEQNKIVYPDAVTFSDGEGDDTVPPRPGTVSSLNKSQHTHLQVNTKIASRDRRSNYRKCVSEVGASLSLSTRAARSKLGKHHHSHHHGIGILQANGIVYDDALLLRLARQARYGRGRGELSHGVDQNVQAPSKDVDKRMNDIKIHVYDLLTKDALVEMPYFNCNFPIGQCFKVVNDGCHVLGTGAYHVGVEVNGVEYAFGANNIIGMSGIFTCVPKESPGYEFRETLDFGKIHTTKRTWIRVPKQGSGTSFKTMSAALGSIGDKHHVEQRRPATTTNAQATSKEMNHLYSFREISSFADGHAVIHSMAREYMGTDYDLLRKNCCTFARDVCIRLGVTDKDIPSWFHNAAQAGADAEDAITSVEYSVRNMLDCADSVDPLDYECYNHGFEVIPEWTGGNNTPEYKGRGTKLKVVESPTMRTPTERKPLSDSEMGLEDINETASWTY